MALQQVRDMFRNAKIVLVGYPLLVSGDNGGYCTLSCGVSPQARLEAGLNVLNAQQQTVVNDLNNVTPGRFAFLPLHNAADTAFFDHHGLGGNQATWIHPIFDTGGPGVG